MPAFIKTEADEKRWSEAKARVRKNYPDLSEDDDQFWAITTSIYKKLRGKNMNKKASARVQSVLEKLAFVPLTPAAEDAMAGGQPQMNPAMPPQGMDPSTEGEPMPPMQSGGIQTVPGPNGEPIDPETGFIVLDPMAGIEQDPLTGILFNKMTGEFATPEGQLLPPEQAQMMIEEAMAAQQGGGMPPQGANDPTAAGAAIPAPEAGMPPMDPAMMQGGDPSVEAMAGGQPMIDPQSGIPLDPATGMFAQAPAMGEAGAAPEGNLEELLGGFVDKSEKIADRQDKLNKRMLHDLAGTRTDIQGVRREIQQLNDNQDTLLARLENVLNVLESMMGAPRGVQNLDR